MALSKSELTGDEIIKVSSLIKKKLGINPIIFSSFTKDGIDQLISKLFQEFELIND